MAGLLARLVLLIGGAFVLGVAVGWAFWRFRRRSVPLSEWREAQHELADLQQQLDDALRSRDVLVAVVESSRQEAARLMAVVSASWNEQNALRHRRAELETLLARRQDELARRAAVVEHLQRRVVELNGLAVRAFDVDIEHHPLVRPSLVPAGSNGAFPPVGPSAADGRDTPFRR